MEKLTIDKYVIGLTRIALGFYMFWAFLDKMFGLGFATPPERAVINGGQATYYYLAVITAESPFHSFFAAIAGKPLTEFFFLGGLALIGLSLILGIGTKYSGIGGAMMMILMWMSALPMTNNPFLDDHIIYALIFLYFATNKEVSSYLSLNVKWLDLNRKRPIPA